MHGHVNVKFSSEILSIWGFTETSESLTKDFHNWGIDCETADISSWQWQPILKQDAKSDMGKARRGLILVFAQNVSMHPNCAHRTASHCQVLLSSSRYCSPHRTLLEEWQGSLEEQVQIFYTFRRNLLCPWEFRRAKSCLGAIHLSPLTL
jgi:hypothetical protein